MQNRNAEPLMGFPDYRDYNLPNIEIDEKTEYLVVKHLVERGYVPTRNMMITYHSSNSPNDMTSKYLFGKIHPPEDSY
jgi:hypothetical protein